MIAGTLKGSDLTNGLYEALVGGLLTAGYSPGDLGIGGRGFCAPGFVVALTALAKRDNVSFAQLRGNERFLGYAQALGMEHALDGVDTYPFERPREGVKYSLTSSPREQAVN